MNTKPRVSVIITCYNYAEYVKQAIESVLSQTYKNIELTIIDDGSTDGSLEVINRYKDRAEIVTRKNRGIVYTRNEAMGLAKGEFLLFVDADDWLDDNYVELLVEAAIKDSLDVVYCDACYFVSEKGDTRSSLDPPVFNLERLKNENFVHMSSLIKLSSVGDVAFDQNTEKVTHEDWDFYLNLALNGAKFGRVNGVALNYRIKPSSRSELMNSEVGVATLYKFIYEKYSKIWPKEIEYLAYGRLADNLVTTNSELEDARAEIIKFKKELTSLDNRLADILNSKSYKLGVSITSPARSLKRFVHKQRILKK